MSLESEVDKFLDHGLSIFDILIIATMTAAMTFGLLRVFPERVVCERCHESLEVDR